MRRLIAVLALFFSVSAHAGTLTLSTTGFSTSPAATPQGWPANVAYPGAQSTNGSKSFTINDADWISILTWLAATQYNNFTAANPATPTLGQILVTYPQLWINGTKTAVQNYFTTPATVPPPITAQ